MRLVFLTPGTGNFHCGSCLHDEALARALRRLGHEAHIVGLYLPLMMDQPERGGEAGRGGDAEHDQKLQMGGVNLYLQERWPWLRHMPGVRRLLDAPAVLRLAADRADLTSPKQLGRMTVEMLRGMHGRTAHELRLMIEHLQHAAYLPGVVMLNNALLLSLAQPIKAALRCKVVCTLHGEDTFLDSLPEPWRGEAWAQLRDAAKACDLFLPVSMYHAKIMRERLALDAARVRVVFNGIEVDDFDAYDLNDSRRATPRRAFAQRTGVSERPARRSPPAGEEDAPPRTIGYLARLSATKGVFTLIDAFVTLAREPDLSDVRLLLVGAATPHDRKQLDAALANLPQHLRRRIAVHPNVERPRKIALLHEMDLLSVPTTYGESFGLYVLEANAAGVPVVQPEHAAFPEVIGATGGGMLYPPDDAGALPGALAAMLRDDTGRRALGDAGRVAVRARFTADHLAANTLAALETICPPAALA